MGLTRRQALTAGAGALTVVAGAGYATAQSDEHAVELLAESSIDHPHACLHGDFDDRVSLQAGVSVEGAPTVADTHVIWEVTYGDAGYVVFDADAHFADAPYVFYTADGSVSPVSGTELDRGEVDDEEYCESLREYVEIDPEDGRIVLELVADSEDDGDGDDNNEDGEEHDDHGEDDHDEDHGHDGFVGDVEIIDRETGDVVADVHGNHWHGDLPEIPVGERVSLGATFEDPDGEEIPIGADEEYQLDAALAEGAAGIVTIDSHGDHVPLVGEEVGETEVVFSLLHGDHADWESPPIAAVVVEADEEDPEEEPEDDEESEGGEEDEPDEPEEDPDGEDEPDEDEEHEAGEEPEDEPAGAALELSVSPSDGVGADETARFDVIARNHGDASEVTVTLEVGGASDSATVEIAAGDCGSETLCAPDLPAGAHEWTVTAGEETVSGTLTVEN